ncbi:hypothetical protein M8J76_016900 [Diaphorina citri]|nr:hypothetical protein M8J76_016900 [Diaphorina citri]
MWIPLLGWISLLVLSLLSRQIWGHVALTFPAARKYDLDFLDNSRTKGPCGMPKGDNRGKQEKMELLRNF